MQVAIVFIVLAVLSAVGCSNPEQSNDRERAVVNQQALREWEIATAKAAADLNSIPDPPGMLSRGKFLIVPCSEDSTGIQLDVWAAREWFPHPKLNPVDAARVISQGRSQILHALQKAGWTIGRQESEQVPDSEGRKITFSTDSLSTVRPDGTKVAMAVGSLYDIYASVGFSGAPKICTKL